MACLVGRSFACASSDLAGPAGDAGIDPPENLPSHGALAQLVERLLCKQDVIGSNPLGSTISSRHDQTAPLAVLSRPVGRGLLRKPFNIVQRDNQRCWPRPSGGAVVDDLRILGPTAALSKSSTLTKCATPAWDLRKCPFRMEGAGNVHAFDRKRSGAGSKRPRPEGRQVLLLPDQIRRDKGVWWMPWQQEAMKDVIPCDKPWGAGNRL